VNAFGSYKLAVINNSYSQPLENPTYNGVGNLTSFYNASEDKMYCVYTDEGGTYSVNTTANISFTNGTGFYMAGLANISGGNIIGNHSSQQVNLSMTYENYTPPTPLPSCHVINVSNTIYSLLKNENCVDINVSNVTVNLNGYSLGNSSLITAGVYIHTSGSTSLRNITIANGTISNAPYGILADSLANITNLTIENLTIDNNTYDGVALYNPVYNSLILNNTITNNCPGLSFEDVYALDITNNTIYNNSEDGTYFNGNVYRLNMSGNNLSYNSENGIDANHSINIVNSSIEHNNISSNSDSGLYIGDYSSNNTIANNTISNNSNWDLNYGSSTCDNNIEQNNGTENLPIWFINSTAAYNAIDWSLYDNLGENISELILCNITNRNIENLTFNRSYYVNNSIWNDGIMLINSQNVTLDNMTSIGNGAGLATYCSSNITIQNSNFSHGGVGLSLDYVDPHNDPDTTLINNTLDRNSIGMRVNNNQVYMSNNTISNSGIDIPVLYSSYGSMGIMGSGGSNITFIGNNYILGTNRTHVPGFNMIGWDIYLDENASLGTNIFYNLSIDGLNLLLDSRNVKISYVNLSNINGIDYTTVSSITMSDGSSVPTGGVLKSPTNYSGLNITNTSSNYSLIIVYYYNPDEFNSSYHIGIGATNTVGDWTVYENASASGPPSNTVISTISPIISPIDSFGYFIPFEYSNTIYVANTVTVTVTNTHTVKNTMYVSSSFNCVDGVASFSVADTNGNPINYANVELMNSDNNLVNSGRTGTDGKIQFNIDQDGAYVLSVVYNKFSYTHSETFNLCKPQSVNPPKPIIEGITKSWIGNDGCTNYIASLENNTIMVITDNSSCIVGITSEKTDAFNAMHDAFKYIYNSSIREKDTFKAMIKYSGALDAYKDEMYSLAKSLAEESKVLAKTAPALNNGLTNNTDDKVVQSQSNSWITYIIWIFIFMLGGGVVYLFLRGRR